VPLIFQVRCYDMHRSLRTERGQCHLYFKYAVTICTVRSFLQSFFFGLLSQRKSVKGSSGSKPSLKNVQLGCRGGVSPPVWRITVGFCGYRLLYARGKTDYTEQTDNCPWQLSAGISNKLQIRNNVTKCPTIPYKKSFIG